MAAVRHAVRRNGEPRDAPVDPRAGTRAIVLSALGRVGIDVS
jgi:hypothetical protein